MAEREELILEVTADLDRAKADVEALERTLKELEEPADIVVDVDTGTAEADVKVLSKELDDAKVAATEFGLEFETTEQKIKAVTTTIEALAETVDAELRASKAAADALGNALGPELSAKVNIDEVVSDLQRMGLTTDEIRGNADQLAASFRQIDGVRTQGLADGLDYTNTRMTGLRNNADQSRSVLANMVGNSAQDVGELGGVAGSAGVAIGQMAEYAVDGNIALGNMAKVAVPLLAVGAAVQAVSSNLKDVRDAKAFDTEKIEAYKEALEGAESELSALREQAEALGGVRITLDPFGEIDVTERLQEAGISLAQWNELVLAGAPAVEELSAAFERQGEITDDQTLLLFALAQAQEEYTTGAHAAAQEALFAAENLQEMREHVESLRDPLETATDQWSLLIQDLRDGELDMLHVEERIKGIAEATGLSTDAVIERAQQEIDQQMEDEADAARDAADAQREYADQIFGTNAIRDAQRVANELNAEQLEAETEALHEAIEVQREYGDQIFGNNAIRDAQREANAFNAAQLEAEAEAARQAAEALREVNEALADTAAALDPAALRASAFAGALNEINTSVSELDSANQTIQFADDLNTLGDAIKALVDSDVDMAGLDLVPDSWAEVQNMPEELGPVVDALTGFRDVMQGEFAQSFEQGGATEARAWAEDTREAIITELEEAGIESGEQVAEILKALGLLPEQVETTIRISTEAQARQVIDDIASAIETLDTEVQLQIAAVAQDDPVAALQLAIDALEGAGVTVPVSLQILQDQFEDDVDAAVSDATAKVLNKPITKVTITPELEPAQAEEDLATLTDEERTATIDTVANTRPADIGLDLVAAERRTATINAVLGDYPTADEIRRRIGTVRVPIQAFWTTRIEGNRPR